MQTTYRPGDWYLLIAPGTMIALPPSVPPALVTRVWERQRTERGLAAVIDALTEHASGSFTAMPSFGAVVLEGPGARIAVRGEVTVRVTGPDGTESFDGANVTTWSERFVAEVHRIAVSVGASEDIALPVVAGVVRAVEAEADVEPAAAADSVAAEPAPAEPAVVDDVELAVAAGGAAVPEPAADEDVEPRTEDLDDPVSHATLLPTEVTYAPGADDFDQLFGATVHSPKAFTAAPPPPPAATAPAGDDGDHDGATISLAEARALRKDVPEAEPDAATAVLPVAEQAGRIRVSTGQVVALDRTVIIGRRPRSTRASGADLPHLVAVESPQQDISRSHLEIRPEGDTVVVIDLHTTNGSTLLRPGADPVRLHPGEQTIVLSGDTIDLGDGVTVAFEDLP